MTFAVTHVFPIFAVPELEEALRYYADALGFEIAWRWGDPPHRAGVRLHAVEFQLDGSRLEPQPRPSVVYCHMTGVAEYYEACRRRGARIAMELGDRPWGARDFRVVDTGGNRIGFAEVLAK